MVGFHQSRLISALIDCGNEIVSKDQMAPTQKKMAGNNEYDDETVERVHQENIRKSKEALEASLPSKDIPTQAKAKPIFGMQPTSKPRKVFDNEISPYQGVGGTKQMQRAQSRKRSQVRKRERSMWDNLAPKEYHGLLNFIYGVVFIIGLLLIFGYNSLL